MLQFKKHYTIKIISIIVSVVFLFTSSTYGIELPKKAHLRAPLNTRQIKERLQNYLYHQIKEESRNSAVSENTDVKDDMGEQEETPTRKDWVRGLAELGLKKVYSLSGKTIVFIFGVILSIFAAVFELGHLAAKRKPKTMWNFVIVNTVLFVVMTFMYPSIAQDRLESGQVKASERSEESLPGELFEDIPKDLISVKQLINSAPTNKAGTKILYDNTDIVMDLMGEDFYRSDYIYVRVKGLDNPLLSIKISKDKEIIKISGNYPKETIAVLLEDVKDLPLYNEIKEALDLPEVTQYMKYRVKRDLQKRQNRKTSIEKFLDKTLPQWEKYKVQRKNMPLPFDYVMVLPRHVGYVMRGSLSEKVLTIGAGPCVILTLYDKETGVGALTHLDAETDINKGVGDILYNLRQLGAKTGNLKARIIGGLEGQSEGLVYDIYVALRAYGIFYAKSSISIVEADVLARSGSKAVILDAKDGKVYDLIGVPSIPKDLAMKMLMIQSDISGQLHSANNPRDLVRDEEKGAKPVKIEKDDFERIKDVKVTADSEAVFFERELTAEFLHNLEVKAQSDLAASRELIEIIPNLEKLIQSDAKTDEEKRIRDIALDILFVAFKEPETFASSYDVSLILQSFERLTPSLVRLMDEGVTVPDISKSPYSHLEWFAEKGHPFAVNALVDIYKTENIESSRYYKVAIALNKILFYHMEIKKKNFPIEKLISLLTSDKLLQEQLKVLSGDDSESKYRFIKQHPDFGYVIMEYSKHDKDLLNKVRRDGDISIWLRAYALGLTISNENDPAVIKEMLEMEDWYNLARKYLNPLQISKFKSAKDMFRGNFILNQHKLRVYILAILLNMDTNPLMFKEDVIIGLIPRIMSAHFNAYVQWAYSLFVIGIERLNDNPFLFLSCWPHEITHSMLYKIGFTGTLSNPNIASMHEFLCDIASFKFLQQLIHSEDDLNKIVKKQRLKYEYAKHLKEWKSRSNDEQIDEHIPARAFLERVIKNNPDGVDWDRLFSIAVEVAMEMKEELSLDTKGYSSFIKFASETERRYSKEKQKNPKLKGDSLEQKKRSFKSETYNKQQKTIRTKKQHRYLNIGGSPSECFRTLYDGFKDQKVTVKYLVKRRIKPEGGHYKETTVWIELRELMKLGLVERDETRKTYYYFLTNAARNLTKEQLDFICSIPELNQFEMSEGDRKRVRKAISNEIPSLFNDIDTMLTPSSIEHKFHRQLKEAGRGL